MRNLLAVIHSETIVKSELIISCKFSGFGELNHRQVSSANNRDVTDVLLIKTLIKHRAGQRCFELLALIGSPQLSFHVN